MPKVYRPSTIYTNRVDPYVIGRLIDNSKDKLINRLQQRRKNIKEQIASLVPLEDVPPIIQQQRREQLATLHRQLQQIENGHFERRWQHIADGIQACDGIHVEKLVYANMLVGRPVEVYHVDTEYCESCLNIQAYDNTRALYICTYCGLVKTALFTTEDRTQAIRRVPPTIVPVTIASKPVTVGPVLTDTTSLIPDVDEDITADVVHIADGNPVDSEYYMTLRVPLYRRFITQFADTAPNIPQAVLQTLYQHLANIHLQNSVRCRPTPVANILRRNKLASWAPSAVRIAKMFNGEPIPTFSPTLINALEQRFRHIFLIANTIKQKLPSFTFLTHVFLRFEKQIALASVFNIHKSKNVISRNYNVIYKLIQYGEQHQIGDPKLLWDISDTI